MQDRDGDADDEIYLQQVDQGTSHIHRDQDNQDAWFWVLKTCENREPKSIRRHDHALQRPQVGH